MTAGDRLELGGDGRHTGPQWLRGDEANETAPLAGYFVADAHAGVRAGSWQLRLVVSNLLNSRRAVFGTFNENRRSGDLERFLTPMTPRAVRLFLSRRFGG